MRAEANDNSVKFIVTMEMAFKLLQGGILTGEEFSLFLVKMNEKYKCEKVRILYQSKLDIYLDQSVNGDTKGA